MTELQPPPIVLYSRPSCPLDQPVRNVLNAAGAQYVYIDIRFDDAARDQVRAINHGNETVPTLVFPDGSSLSEPGVRRLERKLGTLGYSVPAAWRHYVRGLLTNPIYLVALVFVIVAILHVLGVF